MTGTWCGCARAIARSATDAGGAAAHDARAAGHHWTHPHGGLVRLVDASAGRRYIARRTAVRGVRDAGVLYVPGDYCCQPDETGETPRNHLRLSFGQVAGEQIEPGIERLARVLRRGPGRAGGGSIGAGASRKAASMSRTLFWYIFKDLFRIFMMASGALAGIMSFGGLLRPLTHQGLDIGQVGQVLT